MVTMKRVAVYARVSTNDGRQDPDMQLAQLREYCRQRNLEIHREYVDTMSGSRDDRPEYQRLMDDVTKRKVDTVLVWRFDRLSRSLRSLVTAGAVLLC